MTKLSKKSVKTAITNSFGNQSLIANRCGVGRSTISMFLKKHDDIRKLLTQERERQIDVAELGLTTKITEGNLAAIQFLLKTKGKRRGYTEKTEIESQNVTINIDQEIDDKMRILLKNIRDGTNQE